MSRIICSALLVLAAMAAHGAATGKPDPEEWLREAEAAYDRVTSYTAVFHKQQRVAGKLLPEETIFLKYTSVGATSHFEDGICCARKRPLCSARIAETPGNGNTPH